MRTVDHLADLVRRHLKARSRWRILPPGENAVIVLAVVRHDQRLSDMAGSSNGPLDRKFQSSPLAMLPSLPRLSCPSSPSTIARTQVLVLRLRKRRALAHPVSGLRIVLAVLTCVVTMLHLPSAVAPTTRLAHWPARMGTATESPLAVPRKLRPDATGRLVPARSSQGRAGGPNRSSGVSLEAARLAHRGVQLPIMARTCAAWSHCAPYSPVGVRPLQARCSATSATSSGAGRHTGSREAWQVGREGARVLARPYAVQTPWLEVTSVPAPYHCASQAAMP